MKTKLAGMGGAPAQTFVDDVFSTYLYTGNGSTQTITNGIDLAGKGGLVWRKARSSAEANLLTDTVNGGTKYLISNTNAAQGTSANNITSFNSDGFSMGTVVNTNNTTYASWTFRKAAKFFDVVTYTGTGTNNLTIAHNLGIAPGFIIVKAIDDYIDWAIWQVSAGPAQGYLNSSAALTGAVQNFPNTQSSTTTFSVYGPGYGSVINNSGTTYVAYLFAHDPSADGIVQCGSYVGNGSATGPTVSLGWEPQYLMIKESTAANSWTIFDQMRYLNNSGSGYLTPNSTAVENGTSGLIGVLATGFRMLQSGTLLNQSGQTYIYMAIRRPNKPPTSGTQVYNAIARTGTGAVATVNASILTDFVFSAAYSSGSGFNMVFDRLRGANTKLSTATTATEAGYAGLTNTLTGFDNMTGYVVGSDGNQVINDFGFLFVNYAFKRAPGFFDVVCYTGSGGAANISHSLGVTPELVMVKSRSQVDSWCITSKTLNPSGQTLRLNGTESWTSGFTLSDSSTVFSVNVSGIGSTNAGGATYVAYLFATLAGISKVGSYTGNGGTQNIDCGFAAGARFFLVKATSTTGSWWVWDSARGITAGNDPALQLNSTAAEITTADAVDPYSPGITVNQEATCSINANGVSYIFLAVA